MLMKSDINPFESQETKPYKNDPRISAMTDLVDAYQKDELHRYEKILRANQDLLEDPFIAENIDEVSRNMRTKAVLKLIAPYTRFTLDFISKQLEISLAEVQNILGSLVVDNLLRGKIDQCRGTVEVERRTDRERVDAVHEWSKAIGTLWANILNDGDGYRQEEGAGVFSILPGGPGPAGLTSQPTDLVIPGPITVLPMMSGPARSKEHSKGHSKGKPGVILR
jgi:COP9 signalosome complex subunit 2